MRSNGLTASAYSPVADLNPSVAEALLDELRNIHIAAYSQPIEGSTVSGFARPEYTVEVLVRLYVDAAATEEVTELLSTRDPHLVEANEDLSWAQIVAGFDAPVGGAVAPWPVYEDVDPDVDDDAGAPLEDFDPTLYSTTGAPRRRAADPDAWEDRFVPPLPPPLPKLSGADKLSWLGLVGGPLILVMAALFSLPLPTWMGLLAALGFIGGFVSLVIRMDNGDKRLDDPENGAQV